MEGESSLLTGKARVTGVYLPERLMSAAREHAEREERSFSWVVRHALERYLVMNGDQSVDAIARREA